MIIQDTRGFTLIELIIVMAIFLIVIIITAGTFDTVVKKSIQQSKSVETQIEGIVGLELLRADLEQAGFGLPWTFQAAPAATMYSEVDVAASYPTAFWPMGISATSFNDAPANPPRAIQSSETTFNQDSDSHGSKYLVIKSTVAGTNATAKKWTNVSFSSGGKSIRTWGTTDRDLASSDQVIVVKNSLISTPPTRQLMVDSSGKFYTTFGTYSTLTLPHQDGDSFVIYGISSLSSLRMPFNRADYYVRSPAKMPTSCAPNTGILYKATATHSGGGFDPVMPLLDCVADMQVVYGLDTGMGFVNTHTTVAPATPDLIRQQLREIRVYILAQEGTKDLFFTYPSQTVDVGESFDGGATIMGRRFDLQARIGAGWQNYRWKVYTIVVRPKNLIQ
ncbi:prepilin-type N-terminal cleavage/methylation domain-containing protein [Geobacter argillaceus]|uniref:Prepilin-type N-terminal cleavage/methylation domain-containing protein n=1 Tax=Geobacter argillaceus TaxID=345631 RepID=A0A562WTM0_9BACT|nr:prepilin-type N-terminal cleavage/methylation domain-containing protein [Geobacter argillaceus]TWJ32784.1 prepilin-type N-terminal cleavage/methylation domain-containing protein [Geobacter argillaceus]